MKPLEKGPPGVRPAEFTALEAFSRKHASVAQMIDRYMPEGIFDALLQRFRNGGLAAARCSVEKNNVCHPFVS